MLKYIINAVRLRAIYNTTLKELSSLSTKELYDLGIHHSDIRSIAHEATYGKGYSNV